MFKPKRSLISPTNGKNSNNKAFVIQVKIVKLNGQEEIDLLDGLFTLVVINSKNVVWNSHFRHDFSVCSFFVSLDLWLKSTATVSLGRPKKNAYEPSSIQPILIIRFTGLEIIIQFWKNQVSI